MSTNNVRALSRPVIAFRACARYMSLSHLALAEATDGRETISKAGGLCPIHDTRDCVQTYYVAGHIWEWSWRCWRQWRRSS